MSFINLWRIAMAGTGCSCQNRTEPHIDEKCEDVLVKDAATDTRILAAHPSTTPTTLATVIDSLSTVDPDIEALEGRFGELYQGMTITMELGEACDLLGKTRRRTDTFKGLISRLRSEYGVTLIIKSRKNHE